MQVRGRRERGVKRFKTSSLYVVSTGRNGNGAADRICLCSRMRESRKSMEAESECLGRIEGNCSQPGASTEDSLMARNTRQPETPTMGREVPGGEGGYGRQRMMQMSEQPLQHEQRQHTSCNCAPAIAAWPTTALLPRKLSVRRLGPRLLHSSSIKKALFCNSGTTEAGCTHVGARGSGEGGSAGTHPPLGSMTSWRMDTD